MNYIEQEIVFRTESLDRQDVPLSVSSPLLRRLESTARPSVRMLLERSSAPVGAPPAWLERASDSRTLGFTAKHGLSILHVKAPTLGDAAPKLFEQPSLADGRISGRNSASSYWEDRCCRPATGCWERPI